MDEKAQEEKIRQKQADDDEYFMEFRVMRIDSDYNICVEPSSSTPNPVRIIPGPAGLVQRAKLLKENVFILDPDGALMSTQEYMQKVVKDVGEDADFNRGIDNFLKKGKPKQVVAIVKSCSLNALGDLNVTLKDLSGTVLETIHYKVLDVGSYEKDITVGTAMILANAIETERLLMCCKWKVVDLTSCVDVGKFIEEVCLEFSGIVIDTRTLLAKDPQCLAEYNERYISMMEKYFDMYDELKLLQACSDMNDQGVAENGKHSFGPIEEMHPPNDNKHSASRVL
ncbi:hypothetical protein Tco_1394435 [Tanacetum coccineum]